MKNPLLRPPLVTQAATKLEYHPKKDILHDSHAKEDLHKSSAAALEKNADAAFSSSERKLVIASVSATLTPNPLGPSVIVDEPGEGAG